MPKHFPSFDVNNWRRWKQIAGRLLEEYPITLTFDEIRHHMKPVSEVKLERGEIYFALRKTDEYASDRIIKMVYLSDREDRGDTRGGESIFIKVIEYGQFLDDPYIRWRIYGNPTHTKGNHFSKYSSIISWTDLLKIGKGEKFINWIDDNPFEVKL
jgi:hypothetical protein